MTMKDDNDEVPLLKWKQPDRFTLIHLPMTHRLGKIRHCAHNIRRCKTPSGFRAYMAKVNEGLVFQQNKVARPPAEICTEIEAFWSAVFTVAGLNQDDSLNGRKASISNSKEMPRDQK
ncbi:hypothetical protein [Pararhizobium sp.]|uniref:hypothetical protein n=1 Tax=Pararhizobium sp. TaxID=1977563 RepID=UPI003D14281A